MTATGSFLIASGNLNLNSLRPLMDNGIPAFDPVTQYLTLRWNFNLIYKFNIATTLRGDKVRTMILQPKPGAGPGSQTAAITSQPPSNYQGDPSFFLGGGVNALDVLYDNVEPIYSIDLDVEPVAVEMKGNGFTNVNAFTEIPVIIVGYSLSLQNMEVEGYMTCLWTVESR